MPSFPPAEQMAFGDKIAHFGIFAVGAFLLATAVSASRRRFSTASFIAVFFILSFVGIADEFRQMLVPGRSGGDLGDMLANTLGTLAGTLFSYVLHRHFLPLPKHAKPSR